jgi:hypothetical protein
MKRGQIGVEIMYAVGVLLVIFIILTAVAFERRVSVSKAGETVDKKNDCSMIADKLNSIAALGEGYSTWFKTFYFVHVLESGIIYVGDNGTSANEIEVVCTFNGELNQPIYGNMTGRWSIFNNQGKLELNSGEL